MMELRVENLRASLGGARVLRGLSFDARGPSFIGLVGPNGAGKTTLIRAVANLIPFEGEISLDGAPVDSVEPRARAKKIAYLAQGAESHWPLSVERVVALGRLPHLEPFRAASPADEVAIERALELADVTRFRDRDVLTLSGGERARVLLARALAVEAELLLVDEPVASLDPYHQLGVMEVLRAYVDQGRMVIAVLHDLSLAARYCDRLILLDEGIIRADGGPAEVLTAETLRSVYRVEALIGGEGRGFHVQPVKRVE
ncbi:MAG: ABC transporter ATP-binding protein [Parvibaculum sedimenti]